MKNNKKGFTIVELVIVIAVIAILAAVLIPTFTIVVKKAKDSNALSTAKNALENVIGETATTTGITNGTIFAVADKKNTAANHFIAYDSTKEENLAQVSTAKADVLPLPEVSTNVIVVFAKSIAAANVILDDLIGDVTIDFYSGTSAAIAEGNATNYAAGTYFYNNTAVDGKTVHLFLCEDMPEVAVAILK